MGFIFISYSHKDKAYAHKLQNALENEGFDVWIDDRIDYGTTWPKVIQKQLDDCHAFIVVMTKNSYKSEWVHNEVTRARRKKKPFFALLLSGESWLALEAIQYEDVTGGRLPRKKFYENLARVVPQKRKDEPYPPTKPIIPIYSPISKVIGILGIIAVLLWASSWAMPKYIPFLPISTAYTQTRPVISSESLQPTATESTQSSFVPTDEASPNMAPGILFDNGIWWIGMSDSPPVVSEMNIYLNGENQGATSLITIGHKQRGEPSWQEFVSIYSTGHIRLVPYNQTYGSSFVLGPAYWEANDTYFANIQISEIKIDTGGVTSGGPIQMTIRARDYSSGHWPSYHLDITYNIELPDPGVTATEMYVKGDFVVANAFSLDPIRQSNHEGFKWIQLSTMYIDNYYHLSDGIGYLSQDGSILTSDFGDVGCDTIAFTNPKALFTSKPWVEVRHSDDQGWQGNTPNTLVSVDSISQTGIIVPQGYISCSNDPNDDNVGVWLNLESTSLHFNQGDKNTIEFTLAIQDNPILPLESTNDGNSPTEAYSGN